MNSGIYIIFNKMNNNFYIGSAVNLIRRRYRHKTTLNRNRHINPHLQRAWNKYGEDNFFFTIWEECEPDQLLIREQYWMDRLKPEYNICKIAGSCLGRKDTEATKKKKSISRLGIKLSFETRKKMSVAATGRNHSVVTKNKMSLSHKGHIVSLETREKLAIGAMGNKHFLGRKHSLETKAKISATKRKTLGYNKSGD